jgi:hypothetical protein
MSSDEESLASDAPEDSHHNDAPASDEEPGMDDLFGDDDDEEQPTYVHPVCLASPTISSQYTAANSTMMNSTLETMKVAMIAAIPLPGVLQLLPIPKTRKTCRLCH